jgi:hypothetical protein
VLDREEPILITPDMLASKPAQSVRPDGRVDFERGMRHAPPLVLLLIVANVTVFAWEIATDALTRARNTQIQAGALGAGESVRRGWWRLSAPPSFMVGSSTCSAIVWCSISSGWRASTRSERSAWQ